MSLKSFGGVRMKKWTFLVSLLLALIFGSIPAVHADEDQAAPGGDKPAAMDDNGGPDGMQGGMMGGHFDRMKEKLGLSDSQAAKLKDLFKKQMEETKPLRDQMKIDMDTLQQKIDTKASDADVKKVLDALSADRKSMEASRQNMEDAVREILSPTQQAKFVLSMRDRGRQMMGKWMGKWKHGGKGDGKDGSDQDGKGPGGPDSDDNGGAKGN
jgi:Spy/CpxP family protein refolding chaperone